VPYFRSDGFDPLDTNVVVSNVEFCEGAVVPEEQGYMVGGCSAV